MGEAARIVETGHHLDWAAAYDAVAGRASFDTPISTSPCSLNFGQGAANIPESKAQAPVVYLQNIKPPRVG